MYGKHHRSTHATMNRLKKIFSALSDIGIVPPSVAIRTAWAMVKAHVPADDSHQQALKLVDRIITAVCGIADDADKAAAEKGGDPS